MKRVLLDENLPRPLAKLITTDEIEVISVHDMGWAEQKNGELIRSMVQEGFKYLLTADKNLKNQQNLEAYPVKLVLLRTYDNRLKTLSPHLVLIRQSILHMDEGVGFLEIELRHTALPRGDFG